MARGRIVGATSVLDLARAAIAAGQGLAEAVAAAGDGGAVDLDTVELLAPIDHPDTAHLLLTGTGLTHLGSAEGRDQMHCAAKDNPEPTDSMKMFLMGVEGGKPADGGVGAQPEWFYKGDGSCLVAPNQPIASPAFALDAGEEPEIAGVYLIDADGMPVRLGYALANEFSDHVTERGNYLWLAHSKLRQAALGPELCWSATCPPMSAAPAGSCATARRSGRSRSCRARPTCRIRSPISSIIISNMGCSVARADLHVHFFGTATLSFSEGVRTEPGDVFEIEAAPFRLPVRNPIAIAAPVPVAVRAL